MAKFWILNYKGVKSQLIIYIYKNTELQGRIF